MTETERQDLEGNADPVRHRTPSLTSSATSEARLRLALDAGKMAIWSVDSEGNVEVSPEFLRLLKLPEDRKPTLEELLGRYYPGELERVQQIVDQATAAGERYVEWEYRHLWPNDEVRWLLVRAELLRTETGEPAGSVGVIMDITDRKGAEERLRESQAELRAIYDAVPVGLIIAEAPSGKIAGGNAEVERLFGHPVLPSADIASYRDWISFHADGRQVEADEYPLSKALRGQDERPELEVLYRRGDGRDVWLKLVASAIRDEEGTITGAVVAALDIDRKQRTEQALHLLNERLEAEVQQRTAERDRMWRLSTDLMLVARFDGAIEAVNPAWARLLGWHEQDLTGRSFMTLVHPEDVEATLGEMAALERGVTTFRFTNRYKRSDGEYLWISWTAVPGDEHIHAVGRDITAERHAAAELEHAQEALRQSQKLEAMGQLTGGVAHDFNNLLSPIIGGLDLLQRRGFGDERARRILSGALASAERAKTLVQRLLAFARRQPLQPTAVDVARTVLDMADLLASTLGPRIELRIDAPDALPPARADANQLEMALLNLTVNARDAMPEGGTLHIDLSSEEAPPGADDMSPGQYVRIVVRDTGKGMDGETLARCIEPFFSTKGIGQGTGLGLSMVHGLVAQLSGALRVQSRPGAGTIVELWLPVTAAEADEAATDQELSVPRAAGLALVVDDEELVRSSTAEMLEELGYDTIEASSAQDALRVLEERSVDLLVTDHLMPGMTGTQLAQVTQTRFPATKVLIVSGYADVDGLDPNFRRLSKPFRQAELATALAD